MAYRVAQGLLDDAVAGKSGAVAHEVVDRFAAAFNGDLHSGLSGLLDESIDLGELRLRCQFASALIVAQDAEQSAHLSQRGAGGSGDVFELFGHLRVDSGVAERCAGGLDVDDRHAVGDDVVEFPGDARLLLDGHAFGVLLRGVLLLLDQLGADELPLLDDDCGEIHAAGDAGVDEDVDDCAVGTGVCHQQMSDEHRGCRAPDAAEQCGQGHSPVGPESDDEDDDDLRDHHRNHPRPRHTGHVRPQQRQHRAGADRHERAEERAQHRQRHGPDVDDRDDEGQCDGSLVDRDGDRRFHREHDDGENDHRNPGQRLGIESTVRWHEPVEDYHHRHRVPFCDSGRPVRS